MIPAADNTSDFSASFRDRNHGKQTTKHPKQKKSLVNSAAPAHDCFFFPKRQVPVQDFHFVDMRQRQNQLQMDVHYLALCEASSEHTRAIDSNNSKHLLHGQKNQLPPTDSIDFNRCLLMDLMELDSSITMLTKAQVIYQRFLQTLCSPPVSRRNLICVAKSPLSAYSMMMYNSLESRKESTYPASQILG